MPSQSFLAFEQQTRDAELAAANAKLQAKLAEKLARAARTAIRKRQEEMDKNTRRWKREEATRKRNDILVAQCGINWTTIREANSSTWGTHLVAGEGSQLRRRDAGIYWTHCKTCGQWLHYTDDKNATPQVCASPRENAQPFSPGAGRKP